MTNRNHEYFMRKVLELAEEGKGATNPNPMVGALVVKDGKIIASAYHRRVGTLHAEALVLRKADSRAKGATLYVNFEPCNHIGRTPPCTDAIIKSGIKRVYCSMVDPNPLNKGRGIKNLRRNGIDVEVGMLEKEARMLNEVFVKYITKRIPFVTVKIAESLDGKIATKKRDSKWITNEFSRAYVHKLRSEVDAVLVGVNTILADNPLLTSRGNRNPIKVVLDPYLQIPLGAKIFSKKSQALSIVSVLKESLNKKGVIEKIKRLNKKGVLVVAFFSKRGRIDLRKLLKELAELEIAHLLVEGGGDTIAGFIEEKLADRMLCFIAPKVIGGKNAVTSVEGKGVAKVKNALKLKNIKLEVFGEDILVKGDI